MKRMLKKTIPLIFIMSLCSGSLQSQEVRPETGRIRVSVENLRSSRGFVGVALFNAKKGFPDKPERAIDGRSIKAGDSCEIVFDNVPYGTYAISVLHDENGNRKMDKNIIGIPKEGFGTSNNPKIRRGPPTYEDSQVHLDRRELALEIDMNYF
ncbi:MAG: DUF2141 domain-containing protein [Chlorobiaceae bacterium]|nr:DUF2141 domain-containing protein [Chlorobiaceae bacterium]